MIVGAPGPGSSRPVGELIRMWRLRRGLSQLSLAIEADVSSRHVSFLETGRAMPSRQMVLRLADCLDVPLPDRNTLLVAAGFVPEFADRMSASEMSAARDSLEALLARHDPYPALIVDRRWDLVAANESALGIFTEAVAARLLRPPLNVLRLTLHPQGIAPRIRNLAGVRAHLLHMLRRHAEITGDNETIALFEELEAYGPAVGEIATPSGPADVLLPVELVHGGELLRMYATIATFGTALNIALAELSLETFWPMDDTTAASLRAQRAHPSAPEHRRGRDDEDRGQPPQTCHVPRHPMAG